jgi:hypothetical protein
MVQDAISAVGQGYESASEFFNPKDKKRKAEGSSSDQPIKKRIINRKQFNTMGKLARSKRAKRRKPLKKRQPRKRSKRIKRKSRRNFAASGSIKKSEYGGNIEDSQCVYLGVTSSPYEEVYTSLWRSIVKCLFKLAGQDFDNFSSSYGFVNTIRIEYYKGETNIGGVLTVGRSPTDPYASLADVLGDRWKDTIVVDSARYTITAIKLYRGDPTIPAQAYLVHMATINARHLKVQFNCTNEMTLQNRTLAGNAVTADSDDNVITNISNNPLHGKVYFGTGNYVQVKQSRYDQQKPNFVADPIKGIFLVEATASVTGVAMLKKPPSASTFLGIKSTVKCSIQPGEMKRIVAKGTHTYNINVMLDKYQKQMLNALPDEKRSIFFGNTTFIGLEKLLNSRSGENAVQVAWESNLVVKGGYIYRPKTETSAILNVNDTEVLPPS